MAPTTSVEIQAWFKNQIDKLKADRFVHGELADRYRNGAVIAPTL